ncbi:DUF1285 domain-containing protein [Gilvimarinus sp. F26214L]|uniref:DUF1285 domain-containing protein n=1 Tax=Gilvimarinus sp. DZF01 TaxID=3461371 RepID=UPI0040457E02
MSDLFQQAEALQKEHKSGLPPVHKWNPPLSGDIDIRIARDGRWFHEGEEIKRFELVKLFSTILKREGDEYFLVTPVEKWRITVDDAPLVVVDFSRRGSGADQSLIFKTWTEDLVEADQEHPLWVEEHDGEPVPYVMVRNNLPALIGRNVYYHLVELALESARDDSEPVVISSKGASFSLAAKGRGGD